MSAETRGGLRLGRMKSESTACRRVCLNLRTTTLQKYAVVPRGARIEGSSTFSVLNPRVKGLYRE